jgi:hypothetical protein
MKQSNAIFSEDKNYRYVLSRIENPQKEIIMFVGLNPSTANESKNDATITKITKIVRNNGFGGFYMLNLFGIVSAYPEILTKDIVASVGDNDKYLLEYSQKVNKIVFCWGGFKEAKERAEIVKKMFPNKNLCYLHLNKDESPKHPLYCADLQEIKQYKF